MVSTLMRRFIDAAARGRALDEEELDKIPGTTKLRAWAAANPSLFSGELDKALARVKHGDVFK